MIKKKVVILGHFGVGKTSLTNRYVHKLFSDKYLTTIGVTIYKKVVELNTSDSIQMILWDIAGEQDMSLINHKYLKGAHAFVYVVDLTREETFIALEEDLMKLKTHLNDIPYVTVGNKMDLVDESHALSIKHNYQLDFLSSAKTGKNVDNFFFKISKDLHEKT